jgi:hypothetical protein
MKKLLTFSLGMMLTACTFYPLGMTEAEWNTLTKEEKLAARMKDAELYEQRQLRYAIERQNMLREERIEANTDAIKSTSKAATAAATAANAVSTSQQNPINNNVVVSPNINLSNMGNSSNNNTSSSNNNNTLTNNNSK